MNSLNIDWVPEFGTIHTWFAADKHGRIAVMVNNCFGDLPRALLQITDVESLLENMNEFIWEESPIFDAYPENKNGAFSVDLFSHIRFRSHPDKAHITEELKQDWQRLGSQSDVNLAINKGMFLYFGVEGSSPSEDYPVGYEGTTQMGDYFRFLVPTVFASVDDFPQPLRRGIAVSTIIDFEKDRLLDNRQINTWFPAMFAGH